MSSEGEVLLAHEEKWFALASKSGPADRRRAEVAIADLYRRARYEEPVFVWVDSPAAAIVEAKARRLHRRDDVALDVRVAPVFDGGHPPSMYGAWKFRTAVFDSALLPVDSVGINYDYRSRGDGVCSVVKALHVRDNLGVKCSNSEELDALAALVGSVWYWWPYRGTCILSERPMDAHVTESGELHNSFGPALVFCDGWNVWAANGKVLDLDRSSAAAPGR